MPPVPTMNALRCCFGGSDRHASAMTTALSPLSTTLITAILNSAVQVSGSLNRESIGIPPRHAGRSTETNEVELRRPVARVTPSCPQNYATLSGALRRPYAAVQLRGSSVGEGNDERVAHAVRIVVERDRRAVQRGDFVDDREAETAAGGVTAEQPMKSLEHALAFSDRNGRPVVADRQSRCGLGRDPHGDAAAVPAVADCVVQQIVD